MSNRLSHLLTSAPLSRTVRDYEEVGDDFVRFAGGALVTERFAVPLDSENADHFFDLEELEILVETKQLRSSSSAQTLDQYFSREFQRGRVKTFEPLGGSQIRITPESLSLRDWNRFYERYRSSVRDDLCKAVRQLRATEGFLPPPNKRRVKGVVFFNTQDFALSTDLLFRLVEWKMNREWKLGHFNSIEFVLCLTVDMWREGQHPLYGRGIVRTKANEAQVAAITHLYDSWVRYGAAAIGARVEYRETETLPNAMPELGVPNGGKLQWIPQSVK